MLEGDVYPVSMTRMPDSASSRVRNAAQPPEWRGTREPVRPGTAADGPLSASSQTNAHQPEIPLRSNRQFPGGPEHSFQLKNTARGWGDGAFRSLGRALGQVHFAAEYRVILHRQPKRANIALHAAAGPQLHPAAGHHVALYMAQNQHVSGEEVRLNTGVGPDGQPALGKRHRPLHVPIHNQVFTPLYFAANHDALADARGCILHCHGFVPSMSPNKALPELYATRPVASIQKPDSRLGV